MTSENPVVKRRSRQPVNWIWPLVAIALFVIGALNVVEYFDLRAQSYETIRQQEATDVIAEAHQFHRIIDRAERAAEKLAQAIGDGRIPMESYNQALSDLVQSDELFYGGAIAFAPYAYKPQVELYAPYFAKKNDSLEFMQIEDSYDYTLPQHTWFGAAMNSGSRWSDPYFDDSLGDILMTTYSAVFYRDGPEGVKEAIGVVTIDISIDDIGHIVQALDYGSKGYAEVVTADGAYLFSPKKERVLEDESILSPARWNDDEGLQRLREHLLDGSSGVVKLTAAGESSPTWLSIAPIESTGWRIVDNFNQSEISPYTVPMRHKLMYAIAAIVIGLIVLLVFGNFVKPTEGVLSWTTAALLTLVFAIAVNVIWSITGQYESSRNGQFSAVSSQREVLTVQRETSVFSRQHTTREPFFIPTGIYIESLKFTSPNDILIIGSVWQKFDLEKHGHVVRGVLFPGAETVRMSEPSVSRSGNTEVVRWKFQGSLRLALDYRRFPLILDSVSLGLIPRDTLGNVMLVPDLGAYPFLAPKSLPGMGPNVFLAGWELERSFFELRKSQQRTTYGLNDSFEIHKFPELFWTVEVKKVFIHAFISFLTPLILAFIMVFILLLLSTRDREQLEFMRTGVGFDIGVSASIFFVVVLSHISLRQKIISEEIFYLEYFYLLMYANMLWVCFHSIMNVKNPDLIKYLTLGVTAKKAYFPVSFAIMFVFTWLTFFA